MSSPKPSAARNLADRLMKASRSAHASRSHVSRDDTESAVGAAEFATRHLAIALARWFGMYGYHALLSRALADAKKSHAALANVVVRAPLEPFLDGLGECAQSHGPAAMSEGVTSVLTTAIEVLGRLIGEDMAEKLVVQSLSAASQEAEAALNEGTPQ